MSKRNAKEYVERLLADAMAPAHTRQWYELIVPFTGNIPDTVQAIQWFTTRATWCDFIHTAEWFLPEDSVIGRRADGLNFALFKPDWVDATDIPNRLVDIVKNAELLRIARIFYEHRPEIFSFLSAHLQYMRGELREKRNKKVHNPYKKRKGA